MTGMTRTGPSGMSGASSVRPCWMLEFSPSASAVSADSVSAGEGM